MTQTQTRLHRPKTANHRAPHSVRVEPFSYLATVLLIVSCTFLITEASPQVQPVLTSLPTEITRDSALLVNGDRLSGTVVTISDDKLLFHLQLADRTAEFPIRNLSELSFAGPPVPPPERSDVVYFRDGSYLGADVQALSEDTVKAATPSGQEISISKRKVTGIGFYRPDDILFQSDFSSKAAMGLTPVLGSWDVQKGQLVQESPLAFCRAYARVFQAGAVSYEWAMDLSSSTVGGICFYAARCDTRFGDSAYMVTVRGRQAHFYKIIGEARHQGQAAQMKVSQSLVHFKAEYDPRTGEILLWVDDNMIMRLLDPKPLQHGQYVLLHTEGRAIFDDLRIAHLVGGIEGVAASPSLDTVFLSNGDRISGEIRAISHEILLKHAYTASETPISRDRVRSVTFALPQGDVASEDVAAQPRISLWNGDIIFGRVVTMDDQTATLQTALLPELAVSRSILRAITFPQEPPPAPIPDQPTYPLLTIEGDEEDASEAVQQIKENIVEEGHEQDANGGEARDEHEQDEDHHPQ